MRRPSLLYAAILIFVSVGILFIPVYPCLVNEHEGASFPPSERNSQYILPMPPYLVISNGLHWKEATASADWGIDWTYDANPLFIPLLVAFIIAFGAWLWRLDARAKARGDAPNGRTLVRRTALCQAGAFFDLACLFFFTAGYLDHLYMKGLRVRDWPVGLGRMGYEFTNPPVLPTIHTAWALCVIAVLFGVFFLWRAYRAGSTAGTGGNREE
jgi:hypothetical protein